TIFLTREDARIQRQEPTKRLSWRVWAVSTVIICLNGMALISKQVICSTTALRRHRAWRLPTRQQKHEWERHSSSGSPRSFSTKMQMGSCLYFPPFIKNGLLF